MCIFHDIHTKRKLIKCQRLKQLGRSGVVSGNFNVRGDNDNFFLSVRNPKALRFHLCEDYPLSACLGFFRGCGPCCQVHLLCLSTAFIVYDTLGHCVNWDTLKFVCSHCVRQKEEYSPNADWNEIYETTFGLGIENQPPCSRVENN